MRAQPGGRNAVLAALFALSAVPSSAQTRPLLTEEASTAPARTIRLEVGFDYITDEPSFLSGELRDRADGPILNLVYSPSDNVELDLGWVVRTAAIDDPDFGTVSDFGDVSLRAKVRFVEEASGRPAIGARFSVTLPQTSFTPEALGPDTLRMSAQMLLSKHFGSGFGVHLNAGLAIHDQIADLPSQSDFLHYGAALTRRFGPGLEAVLEAAGLLGDGQAGTDERGEVRAGIRFGSGRIRWDAALRRGFRPADGEWGISGGLTWHIREGS